MSFFPPTHLMFYTCSTRPPAFCRFFVVFFLLLFPDVTALLNLLNLRPIINVVHEH